MRNKSDRRDELSNSAATGRGAAINATRGRGIRLPFICIAVGAAVLYCSERSVASFFDSRETERGFSALESFAWATVKLFRNAEAVAVEERSSSQSSSSRGTLVTNSPANVAKPTDTLAETSSEAGPAQEPAVTPSITAGRDAASPLTSAWSERAGLSIGPNLRIASQAGASSSTKSRGVEPHAASRTINWDADNPIGNFSFNNNWFGDNQPAWGSDADLHFSFRNNPSQTSLYDDYNSWRDINDIFFDSTYGQSTPINGDANSGINFNQRVENNSSFAQTINIPLSGAKFGATQIELNPVNADLTINGNIYNDNNKPYYVYGANGKTLTVSSPLIGNSSVGFNIVQNSNVVFSGATANTFLGTTTISAGSLTLSKTSGTNAIAGDVLVNGGTLKYGGSNDNQIADSAKLTISSGTYAVGSRSETIGQVASPASGFAMSGGAVTIGSSGNLSLANSASMLGGTMTFTAASGAINMNTEFNFNGGTIDFQSTSASSTAALNLRAGNGTGVTYSASSTTAAVISNSGGGTGRVSLNSGAGGVTTVFNIADAPTIATEMTIAATINGTSTSNLQKSGAGVLALTGTNNYTGSTTVAANGGTLQAGVGSLISTSAVTVNSGGTLLLSGTGDHIGANTPLTLAGGTFATNSVSEGTASSTNTGLGALTLTANSTIDFGSGTNSVLQFAGIGAHTPTSGPDLSITNWTHGIGPNPAGTAGDGLYFLGSSTAFLTQYSQSDVIFNGVAGYTVFDYVGYYEVAGLTAVPEPSTWIAAGLTAALIGSQMVRRRRSGATSAS